MIGPSSGVEFLQKKYKLNADLGVVNTAKRKNLPEYDYSTRIQSYLDRLGRDVKIDKHGVLKHHLYDQIIIKPEEVPEGYFQSIIKRHEEEGRPIDSIPDDIRKDLTDSLIKDQRESLDTWIDYLNSPDARYPDWFKYHALRSVLVMGRYNKETKKFMERSKTGKSVSQFPELIRDALAFVADALEAKQKDTLGNLKYGYGIKPEEKAEFERLLREGDPNFSRLYAWSIDKITPISEELLQQTKGQWVKYSKGSDPQKIVDGLAQYGTGWCIRGEGMATKYLETSDLEIYYSLDSNNNSSVPRIVIVTRDGRIDEVRGVAEQEHWDPYITDVVEQKLAELPDGQKFKKRVADMQKMTAIHRKSFLVDKKSGVKTYLNPTLTKEELKFLYEVNDKIEGFGYMIPDPRITEILAKRNPEDDMPIVFDCEKSQIAKNVGEIKYDTKAYVGRLVPNIFRLLPSQVEHIYTSFPEGKIRIDQLQIGGKSKEVLIPELKKTPFKVSPYAESMMQNRDFTTLPKPEEITTIRLKISDLGFTGYTTTTELFERAKSFGLELCPAETGSHLRLKDADQPLNEWYYIAMKQISVSGGYPAVFRLAHSGGGLWLGGGWAEPGSRWGPEDGFVFRLRK